MNIVSEHDIIILLVDSFNVIYGVYLSSFHKAMFNENKTSFFRVARIDEHVSNHKSY